VTVTEHRQTAFDTAACYMPVTMGGVRHLTYMPPIAPYAGTRVELACELVRTVGRETWHDALFDCHLCTVLYDPTRAARSARPSPDGAALTG
jgi:hypothetical protein